MLPIRFSSLSKTNDPNRTIAGAALRLIRPTQTPKFAPLPSEAEGEVGRAKQCPGGGRANAQHQSGPLSTPGPALPRSCFARSTPPAMNCGRGASRGEAGSCLSILTPSVRYISARSPRSFNPQPKAQVLLTRSGAWRGFSGTVRGCSVVVVAGFYQTTVRAPPAPAPSAAG